MNRHFWNLWQAVDTVIKKHSFQTINLGEYSKIFKTLEFPEVSKSVSFHLNLDQDLTVLGLCYQKCNFCISGAAGYVSARGQPSRVPCWRPAELVLAGLEPPLAAAEHHSNLLGSVTKNCSTSSHCQEGENVSHHLPLWSVACRVAHFCWWKRNAYLIMLWS